MPEASVVPNFGVAFQYDVVSPSLTGGFSKVGGLKEEIEVEEKRDGADPFQTRKIVGAFKGGTLVLAKGVVKDFTAFYAWYQRVKTPFTNFRETVGVTINNIEGNPVRRFNFLQAWPFSYEVSDLEAKTSEMAVESISIAFETMEFVVVENRG